MPDPASTAKPNAFEGLSALAEACARNTPVEVVRRGRGDQEPAARGRLIELGGDYLIIEKVHVIGRDVRYPPGSDIDCYFNYAGTILHFRSRIIDAGHPVKLNDQIVLPGMRVELPEEVHAGQRRQVFRVALNTLPAPPKIELWFDRDVFAAHERSLNELDNARAKSTPTEPPPEPPQRSSVLDWLAPNFQGIATDGSDTGVGVMIPGAMYSRFKMFERLWVRVAIPREPEPILFVAEVRHTRDVPGFGARVGIMFLNEEDLLTGHSYKVRKLMAFLTEVQRALRR